MSRKTRHYTKAIIAVCIIAVMLLSHTMRTLSAEGSNVEVSTYEELVTAITEASDGDTIGIIDRIDIPAKSTLGDPTKRITLTRVNENARFVFPLNNNNGSFTQVQNITFEGNNIPSSNPYILIYNSSSFTDVSVNNAISTGNGGAMFILTGEATFTKCSFSNNTSGGAGGHIFIAGTDVSIDNSTFIGGSSKKGGAICFNNKSATLNISNSLITSNTSTGAGGGIANQGALTATNTKIYNNTASSGGADIFSDGWKSLDTIETLTALFIEDNIKPLSWISDIEGGSVDTYLKLDYEVISEPTPEPTEPPIEEPTPTPVEEPTPEPTEEPTPSPEPTEEPTPEPTPTEAPDPIEEVTPTPEPEEDPIVTPTPIPEDPTPTPIPEIEEPDPTPAPIEDPKPTPTEAPSSPTPTPEPTPTTKPSNSSNNSSNNDYREPTPTVTPTPDPTPTVTPSPTPTPIKKPTVTPTPKPEVTVKPTEAPKKEKEELVSQSIKDSSKPITATPAPTEKPKEEEKKEDPIVETTTTPEEVIEVLGTTLKDKNIKIDAKGVDLLFEVTDEGYSISINANKPEEVSQPVMAQYEPTPTTSNDPNWVEVATLIVLAIFTISQFIKGKKA